MKLVGRSFLKALRSTNSNIRLKSSGQSSHAVYGCGLVDTGSLISNSKLRSTTSLLEFRKPTHITYCMAKDIRKIAAGFGFSVFASRDKVYGGGVDIFSNELESVGLWKNGRRVMIGDLEENIVDVAAGRRHFLVATKRKVFALGDNAHGQCGFDPAKRPFLKPNENQTPCIEVPSDSEIKQVHCTLDTSFILMESGELFSFGLGTDGQLGRSAAVRDWHCLPVEGDFKGTPVVSITGSTDTLCAVTKSGELFMWGQNEYEQMAPFASEIQVSYPVEIRLSIGKVRSADTTATSCIVLTSEGQVFVWGFGVIGQGPDINSLMRPAQLHANLFSGGPGDDGKVEKIYAGNTSMFAVSKRNNLFAWGINRFSHLGLGSDKDQYFPYQVCVPRLPAEVAVAPDHTLLLLK